MVVKCLKLLLFISPIIFQQAFAVTPAIQGIVAGATIISGLKDGTEMLSGLGDVVSSEEIESSFAAVLLVDQSGEVKGRVIIDDAEVAHNEFHFIKSQAGFIFAIQKSVVNSINASGGSEAVFNQIFINGVRTGGMYLRQYHEVNGGVMLLNGGKYRGNVINIQ